MPTSHSSLYRQLLLLAWPLILSNLCVPLLGLIDTALLGNLTSPIYLSATAIGASLTMLIVSSFNFLRMTSTGLSAQAFGEANTLKNERQSSIDLQQGLLLALFIGISIAVLHQPLSQLGLMLMSIGSEHRALAQQYTEIRLLAAPASLMNFVLIGFAIGRQKSHLALIILLVNCSINVIADYLFIIEYQLNSQGAAIASVIAEYSALFLALNLCWRQFPFLRAQGFTAKRQSFQRQWQLNSPLLIRSLFLLGVFASFMALSENLGSHVVACNAVLMQLVLLQSYALDGLANATESKVGEALGMKNHAALVNVLKASALISGACALLLTTSLWLSHQWIAPLFTRNRSVAALINEHLVWVVIMPLIAVWAYWLDGIAVGLTQAKPMRNSIVFTSICIYAPSYYIATDIFDLSNHGLWLAFILFSGARAFLLLPLLKTAIHFK